jgi:hypothetical protein
MPRKYVRKTKNRADKIALIKSAWSTAPLKSAKGSKRLYGQ